jgi:hypothetical protein
MRQQQGIYSNRGFKRSGPLVSPSAQPNLEAFIRRRKAAFSLCVSSVVRRNAIASIIGFGGGEDAAHRPATARHLLFAPRDKLPAVMVEVFADD